MGLLLSVLVACVGVIELISFYSNVKRNLTLPPVSGNLAAVRENYIREISDITKGSATDLLGNGSLVKENALPAHHVPTFRLNSHEDIEVEYNRKVLSKSRTPSPRRFLVTEKDTRSSPSPRHFVISEEPQGISKSQCHTSLPEFFIQEQKNLKKSPNHPRYVLRDHDCRSGSPIPLPSQFLVTEKEANDLQLNNDEEYHRRSPSPYPPLDVTQVPRNSICNELVDDPVVSVLEVDEELYKSRSSSPSNLKANFGNKPSSSNTRVTQAQKDLLNEAIIDRPRSKSESNHHDRPAQLAQRATSSSQLNGKVYSDSSVETFQEEYFQYATTYDESYLNNLDGVGKQNILKRSFSSKRTAKRLSVNNSLEETKSEESFNNENSHVKELELSCNSKESPAVASTSKNQEVKRDPEPFWVNH